MKTRMLGDGLRVSALGLGCMPMVGRWAGDCEPPGATAGARYGDFYMSMVDR